MHPLAHACEHQHIQNDLIYTVVFTDEDTDLFLHVHAPLKVSFTHGPLLTLSTLLMSTKGGIWEKDNTQDRQTGTCEQLAEPLFSLFSVFSPDFTAHCFCFCDAPIETNTFLMNITLL